MKEYKETAVLPEAQRNTKEAPQVCCTRAVAGSDNPAQGKH